MTKKIHLPTFLLASICAILGLWLQINQPNFQDFVISLLLLIIGNGLFLSLIIKLRKNDN